MKKLFLMLTAVLLTAVCAIAQTKTVTGTVVYSGDNEPLAGATVMPVGGGKGTATDLDGNFTLTVPTKVNKLTVSYVGMVTRDVPITSGNMLIKLDNTDTSLDEVMVVAYGTAKKSAFTGSATVIKADQIEKSQVSNALDALSGRVSGVQLNNDSGAPGSNPSILIRGISSISAGTSPLIILDGAPFNGDMNTINTADIASMTVLKDAASTALYGARAANGVIIITTKAGQRSTAGRVTVDVKWGGNSKSLQDYDIIRDPRQYYEIQYAALYNYAYSNNGSGFENIYHNPQAANVWANNNLINGDRGLQYNVFTVPNGQPLIGMNGKLNPNATLGRHMSFRGQDYYLYPDQWEDAAYSHSLRQEYNVAFQNGNDVSSFFASFGYLKNDGIAPNSGFERITGSLRAENQVKSWLKVSGSANYSHFNLNWLDGEGDASSPVNLFAAATQVAPIYPLYLRDGQGNIMVDQYGYQRYDYGDGAVLGFIRPVFANSNAISQSLLDRNYSEGNSFNGMGSVEVRFLKDFKFTSNNNVGLQEVRGTSMGNPFYGQSGLNGGSVSKSHSRSLTWMYQQMLQWNHVFNGVNNVSATFVHENFWSKNASLSGYMTNMIDINNHELAGCITDGSSGSSTSSYNNEGWMFRGEYDYDSRYFGSFSIRRDGSSRFHPDHRWGNFWSLGGAWIISKEKWFEATWVDQLKIKASYGEVGNDNIGDFRYTNVFEISNSAGKPSVKPSTMGNPDITWEKNGNFNAGVEFSLFNERLSGNVEFFYKKTSDMLFDFSLPPSYGYTDYYDNVGDMTNTGLEVELNGVLVKTRDFYWDLNLNLTWYKNKVTYLDPQNKTLTMDGYDGYSDGDYFIGQGLPLYTLYMKDYAGVNPETGECMYYYNIKDDQGNPTGARGQTTKIDEGDMYLCGSTLPKVYGGFGTSAAFKGFDLSVQFNYQLGGKCYDSTYASLMGNPYGSSVGSNYHADVLKAWTPDNINSKYPRLQYGDQQASQTSSRFLISASYLSLQNVNFGYTLPAKWTRKAMIDKVRIYFAGENLWLWSKRQGLNPRQSVSGGGGNSYYAPVRTLSGGINVVF